MITEADDGQRIAQDRPRTRKRHAAGGRRCVADARHDDGHQASRMRGSSHAWSRSTTRLTTHVERRPEEGDAHDRRVVHVEDGLDRERAQAGPVEHDLHEERARQRVGEHQADDGQHRQQRVAQREAAEDAPLARCRRPGPCGCSRGPGSRAWTPRVMRAMSPMGYAASVRAGRIRCHMTSTKATALRPSSASSGQEPGDRRDGRREAQVGVDPARQRQQVERPEEQRPAGSGPGRTPAARRR